MKQPEHASELLNKEKICDQLSVPQAELIKEVVILDSISSTNDWVMKKVTEEENFPLTCFAEHQTNGRGRNNRSWYSPESQNIYMSLAWQFELEISEFSMLSLAVGVAIADLLKKMGIDAKVKWPNDILVNQKKISGVLIESKIKSDGRINAIIGVGVNFNMQSTEKIDQDWTDIVKESEGVQVQDRSVLAGQLLSSIMDVCMSMLDMQYAEFLQQWNEYDICLDANLKLIDGDNVFYGKGMGLNRDGGYRVLVDGQEQIFYAVDVSLRLSESC